MELRNKDEGEKPPPDGPATFEEAITATGFGKFNLLLVLIALPSAWSTMMATTTNSFILPVAHCDLHLTLEDKGMLNGITYLGMVTSGAIWGFLSDTLGRKKLLVTGYLLDGIFVILAGSTQNLSVVLFAKFMNGCTINGPFALFTTVISEFHCARYRARVLMFMGLFYTLANILLPLLGWLVLPADIDIKLFNGFIVLHSWNVFILLCSLPSLTSGFLHMLLPESPKFLMTVGRNDEALKTFQKLYSWNTGNAPETFPIKQLIDENKMRTENGYKHGGVITANRTKTQAIREGFQQVKPLFYPPHGFRMLLVCLIQFGIMLGLNTIRLWLPQIFTAISSYEEEHNQDASLCIMLESVKNANETISCHPETNDAVYINSIIVAVTSIATYLVATMFINLFGKKKIFLFFGVTGGLLAFGLYAATNSPSAIAISSLYASFLGICTNLCLTVVVDLFPTSLRTLTVSFVMMTGRLGALMGNVVFPYLLQMGCFPPFATIGFIVLISTLLILILPSTDLKALE